jgi:hypothetical protein
MNKDLEPLTREGLLKALDLIHLNNEQIRLLGERKLDQETMAWTVKHLSECYECCLAAPELTSKEIRNALTETDYDRNGLIEQTTDYYFETLNEIKQKMDKNNC